MSNTPKEPGASTATPTPTGEPETPTATPPKEPGEKQPAKLKITKNKNGTFRVDDLQFKINSMNKSTITLKSGNKTYKIGKTNNTYTIDGVTFQIQSSNIQPQPNGSIMVNVHAVAAPSVEQTSSVKQAPQTTQMTNKQRANIDQHIGTKEVQQQAIHWHLIGKDMTWKKKFSEFIDSQKERLQQVKNPRERDKLFKEIKELNTSDKKTLRNQYLAYQFYNPSGIGNRDPSPKTPEEVQERFKGLADFVKEKYENDFNTFVGVYRSAIKAEYDKLKYQNQFPQQSAASSTSEPSGFVNVTKPQPHALKGGKKHTTRKRRPSKMSKRLKTRRVT